VADLNVTIFTFNDNEAKAVDLLLNSYVNGTTASPGAWGRFPVSQQRLRVHTATNCGAFGYEGVAAVLRVQRSFTVA
jgi:hypothetical protein